MTDALNQCFSIFFFNEKTLLCKNVLRTTPCVISKPKRFQLKCYTQFLHFIFSVILENLRGPRRGTSVITGGQDPHLEKRTFEDRYETHIKLSEV